MSRLNLFVAKTTLPLITFGTLGFFSPNQVIAANTIEIACEMDTAIPTVTATLSQTQQSSPENYSISQKTEVLSFLPEYFSPEAASINCKQTANSLQGYYDRGMMKYLASDTIDGQPVVCAVERRGVRCDGYSSEVLFAINQSVSPAQLLYNMLGGNFKDSQLPSSRTVSRIYTDLRPAWWPFP